MQCPVNHTTDASLGGGLEIMNKLQVHCKVCGGITSGDIEPEVGRLELDIWWGPSVFSPDMVNGVLGKDGEIDELKSGILGYGVFATDKCGMRTGPALATVNAMGIAEGSKSCCEIQLYHALIKYKLPEGYTSMRFMIVPLTDIGALEYGWTTIVIPDDGQGFSKYYGDGGSFKTSTEEPESPSPPPPPPPPPATTRRPVATTEADLLTSVAAAEATKKANADHANGFKAMTALFAVAVSACLLY
jgi:hypothetical protein